MANTQSWVERTPEEVLEDLAEQAAVTRAWRKAASEKQALSFPEGLRDLAGHAWDSVKESPALGAGLAGAGLGAGLGALSSYGRPEEDRQTLRSALTGALAGGATGAGAGMLANHFRGSGGAPPHASGETFEHGGHHYQLDPQALQDNPNLPQQVTDASHRTPVQQGVSGAWDGFKNYFSNHPVLGSIMGVDVASHALGSANEKFNRGSSMSDEHFRSGFQQLSKVKPENALEPVTKAQAAAAALQNAGEPARRQVLQSIRLGQGIPKSLAKSIPGMTPEDLARLTPEAIEDIVRAGSGAVRRGTVSDAAQLFGGIANLPHRLSGGHIPKFVGGDALAGTGYTAGGQFSSMGKARAGTGPLNAAMRWAGKAKSPFGTSALSRIGGRVGLYGGIPLAQYLLGQHGQAGQQDYNMDELIRRHAHQVD